MCLDTIFRGKQKRDALAKLPESGYYWKVVDVIEGGYVAPSFYTRYIAGWNKAKISNRRKYPRSFHIFRYRKDAIKWQIGYSSYLHDEQKVIRCKVDKKDIIAIGTQNGNHLTNGLCIVTTRFWCPKPK